MKRPDAITTAPQALAAYQAYFRVLAQNDEIEPHPVLAEWAAAITADEAQRLGSMIDRFSRELPFGEYALFANAATPWTREHRDQGPSFATMQQKERCHALAQQIQDHIERRGNAWVRGCPPKKP